MGIIGKNIKKFQEKIGIYFKNKIQINKREEHWSPGDLRKYQKKFF